jgi:hypothetical protein
MQFRIVPFKRYWAVYLKGELVCLTVYKKGAEEVIRRFAELGMRAKQPSSPTTERRHPC